MKPAFQETLNFGRFETWTTKPTTSCFEVKQVHSIDIAPIETLPCKADGIIISWDNLKKPVAIKTADCMPIIIEGEQGVVFLHVGWRGLSLGILNRPEIKFIQPNRVLIGPSIQDCCFEVSRDFKENFPHSSFFKVRNGKTYFDLQEEAKKRLLNAFPNLFFEVSELCTCCSGLFHSYRKDKTESRNWNLYIKG